METPPPFFTAEPPPFLPAESTPLRRAFAVVLSLCLILFVADAAVSMIDDCLIVFLHVHLISFERGLLAILSMLMAVGIYGLMGLTPLVPKRPFVLIPAFTLIATLAAFPCMIYCHDQVQVVALAISVVQLIIAARILYLCR